MKQPYIYTMPESFVIDTDVPVRWRLWAVLNGFFLNSQKCWASNEWLGLKVNAHKDSVSQGVKELEEFGLIKCERTRRSRIISPILKIPEIGVDAYGGGVSPPISDRSERLSISDSNSDSYTSVAPLRIESESEKTTKEKKDTSYLRVFELWGKYPLNWRKNTTEIDAAKNLLLEHGLEDVKEAFEYYQKNKLKSWIPVISGPSDLDRKWLKLEDYYDKQHGKV